MLGPYAGAYMGHETRELGPSGVQSVYFLHYKPDGTDYGPTGGRSR